MTNLPILDPPPSGKPQDFSLRAIKQEQVRKGIARAVVRPAEWHSPLVKHCADHDQDKRGTCTGQAYSRAADLNYMKLTGDIPTAEQKAQFKKDVIDSLGTRHDVLFQKSFSPECAYQMGRFVGNITYPSGGEIRFNARAYRDYGMVLEDHWHTDKEGLKVWMYPPGARKIDDLSLTPEEAAAFAALHRIKGWAMVGRADGFATWDEICDAVYEYDYVICAIPIYDNYGEIQGQAVPVYPNPSGRECVGYHAQLITGYTSDELDIEHSWGTWCGQHGKLPREYYNYAQDLSVWLVLIDDEETLITGKEIHRSFNVTCNVPAQVSVDGVVIGPAPQKVALEVGRGYTITVSADGYYARSKTVDDSVTDQEWNVALDPIPVPVKGFWEIIIEFIRSLFKW